MKVHRNNARLAVEPLEPRRLATAVVYADFNNDGLVDMAAITNPTTVTVSLAKLDGTYTVSATLTAPKNRTLDSIAVADTNNDGNLDILGGTGSGGPKFSTNVWLGNGDGTFGGRKTANSHPNNHGGF